MTCIQISLRLAVETAKKVLEKDSCVESLQSKVSHLDSDLKSLRLEELLISKSYLRRIAVKILTGLPQVSIKTGALNKQLKRHKFLPFGDKSMEILEGLGGYAATQGLCVCMSFVWMFLWKVNLLVECEHVPRLGCVIRSKSYPGLIERGSRVARIWAASPKVTDCPAEVFYLRSRVSEDVKVDCKIVDH